MIIRKPERSEADVLTDLAIRSKASNGYDEAFMAACRDELTITADTFGSRELWVAVDDDSAIVGFFALSPADGDGMCEVDLLFVDPQRKSRGIGSLLWRKIEERARNAGAKSIGADADPAAVRYYVRMGCAVIGRSPSQSIPGRLLPRMEKRL